MSKQIEVVVETPGGEVFQRTLLVKRVLCAGYAGRDQESVRHHIEELKKLGVPAPSETPTLYVVTPSQVVTSEVIEVQGGQTSGEVEYVLYIDEEEWFVTVGSDHTDRELERHDVAKSKQICPKVIAGRFWRFRDLADHWDRLLIKSRVSVAASKVQYQSGLLSELIRPEQLVEHITRKLGQVRQGDLLFSGTIPTPTGLIVSDFFEMELFDPVLNRTIAHQYRVERIT